MPREQFYEIQIHLADDRGNAAVLQSVDVPTGLSDWLLASCNSGFGGQAAIFGKDAVNRIPIETTLLGEKKEVSRISGPLVQPGPQGGHLIHARAPAHSKEGLGSLQRPLEPTNGDLHIAPIDVTEPERD